MDTQPSDADNLTTSSKAEEEATAAIVNQVRTFLEGLYRNANDQDCPVCFVIYGFKKTGHASGIDCPERLCRGESEWSAFREAVKLDASRGFCWKCYLPTVSVCRSRHCGLLSAL